MHKVKSDTISDCNRKETSAINKEIWTSKFKAKRSNEPVGRVSNFYLNFYKSKFIIREAVAITH